MKKNLAIYYKDIYFPFLIFCFLSYLLSDNITSLTVDLASHYSLINKIQKDFFINTGYVLNLGEMNEYPPISHYLAAAFGVLFGSPLYGISIVSTVAICIFYKTLFDIINSKGLIPTICIVALSYFSTQMPLVGHEVIGGNFLFPQLIGTSVFILIAKFVFRRNDQIDYKFVLALLFIYLAMLSIHPSIGTVTYAFILFYLISINVKKLVLSEDVRYRPTILFAILGILIFKFHPYTKFASAVRTHNGALGFEALGIGAYELSLLVYLIVFISFIHALTCIVLCIRNSDTKSVNFNLSLLLISFAGIAIAQIILFEFAKVSAYVVKKNLFGIFTFWLILLSVQIIDLINLKDARISRFKTILKSKYTSTIASAVVCSLLLFPINNKISEYMPILNELNKFQSQSVDKTYYHKTITNLDVPMPINWLFSIGELEVYKWGPLSHSIVHNLQNELPDDSSLITDQIIFDTPYEKIGKDLYLYSFTDFNKLKILPLNVNAVEYGKLNSGINFYLKKGFAGHADWGHWSVGENSKVQFKLSSNDRLLMNLKLRIKLVGFINEKHKSCNLNIYLNKKLMSQVVIDKNGFVEYFVNIPYGSSAIEVDFESKNPVSPKSILLSHDERELCFGLSDLTLIN